MNTLMVLSVGLVSANISEQLWKPAGPHLKLEVVGRYTITPPYLDYVIVSDRLNITGVYRGPVKLQLGVRNHSIFREADVVVACKLNVKKRRWELLPRSSFDVAYDTMFLKTEVQYPETIIAAFMAPPEYTTFFILAVIITVVTVAACLISVTNRICAGFIHYGSVAP